MTQDLRATREYRKYEKAAKLRRLPGAAVNELREALRDKLKGRPHPTWPKREGELHIFLALTVSNWESVLPAALAAFGRVTIFDWRQRGFDDRSRTWPSIRDQMNEEMLRAFREANSVQPVDVVCGYLSGYLVNGDILLQMKKHGAAAFNFCLDDVLNFPGKTIDGRYVSTAAIADVVDLNLTNVAGSIIKYNVHNGLAMFFPEAGYPEVHRPYPSEFLYDVTFVGAKYGWRPTFIRGLSKRGINVTCFGPGWPNGPLSDREMVRLYSRSRVNLGFSAIGYSRRLRCLKGRDFEVPMSGGLYLTQQNPDINRVFDIGKEILTYENVAECETRIRWVKANPEEAEKIRKAGRARSLRDHTYEARWGEVFELAGILRRSP